MFLLILLLQLFELLLSEKEWEIMLIDNTCI
jgi:hypothetical protein